MSVKNFRFVSPGVFVNEIDNSQLPATPAGIGPVIVGRSEKGPALRPTQVRSFEEFVNLFGAPAPGNGGGDVWRKGNNTTAATYGAYAAQAYLRNSSPLTYVRLLGAESDNVSADDQSGADEAGWSLTNGRAYGLVIFQTGSEANNTALTGALGAILYTQNNYDLKLSGNLLAVHNAGAFETTVPVSGTDVIVQSTNAASREFRIMIQNDDLDGGTASEEIVFNFTKGDSKYIRKALNTNPQLLNSNITDTSNVKNYFLGETFDRHLDNSDVLQANPATLFGALVRIKKGTTEGDDFKYELQSARTPQIISCRLSPTDVPVNLFQLVALGDPGEWTNKNLKVSIQDIKRSTNNDDAYGTFSVVIRRLSDSDNVVEVVEQFDNCDLNPNSLNYVARKIGDKRLVWSTTERRYYEQGNYDNNSKYMYISMNSDVDAGLVNPSLLPFGCQGIAKYTDESVVEGTATGYWVSGSTPNLAGDGAGSAITQYTSGSVFVVSASTPVIVANDLTFNVAYPRPVLRGTARQGNLQNPTDAYFGFQTGQGVGSTVFASSIEDLLSPRGGMVGTYVSSSATRSDLSPTFTLDDISGTLGTYSTGSHATNSLTYVFGAVSGVLDQGFDRFTAPVFGGFDGTDILEMDPFSSARMPTSPGEDSSYSFYSVKRAIDSCADPEVVEMNMLSVPGQTQEGLTTHLVRTCEERGDALGVIDLPDAFTPREDGTAVNRRNTASTITTLVNGLRNRGLNTSYGCTYYPWVRARDTINGALLWLPPSVAAIGTFSSSQRKTQVWFAPAGFNRGGLTEGSAGIPVIDVAHQLRRKDRDDLYEANINPIAKFPAEGIVIFGQKTLQVTPSALDRINVRRLMIFVKKRISQIAATILFDPNIQVTWDRFTAQVNPFLSSVKTNFGLSDYRVVLDNSTTTPELVDRNILYAQIFLKPTRAIEFIAIDFNISRTGASFAD